MIKPDDINWEHMAIQLQDALDKEHAAFGNLQQTVYGLEDDVEKLKAVIEYLEIKLGINDSI